MSQTKHKPYVGDERSMLELTLPSLIAGSILGIIFGAASLYLALKVGMTVSASIPIAVVSITLFKAFSRFTGFRKTTILENNIMQTTGSAGESIAFGVAVTMPALLILGHDLDLMRIMWVAVLGGLLGVLMMIPLRQTLIVQEHGKLAYPEGTACAEVLIVGEKGGTSAATVFGGFFFGLIYKFMNVGTRLWTDVVERTLGFFKGAAVSAEISPELVGVGYIIGPRVASIMVAGGVLSSWVLIPAIYMFGSGSTTPMFPAPKPISELGIMEVWKYYVLYIGAGAVAAGGIISLIQSLPTIARSAVAGLKSVRGSRASVRRTENDLPMNVVLWGSAALILLIWLSPVLHINFAGAVLMVLFGFLFVTVSSRITGSIGSSSNPISGMTVATLLITSLVFLAFGWVSPEYRVTALSVAAVVCVASSNGGTTSQDLKTGFLVGATPRAQQIGLLVGVITSGIVIGYTLKLLNDASTVHTQKNLPAVTVSTKRVMNETERYQGREYGVLRVTDSNRDGELAGVPAGKYLVDRASGKFAFLVDPGINGTVRTRDDGTPVPKYEAPKARLMSMIIDGILAQKLPWGLVLLGVAIALTLELCGVAALPFAVGVYLPLAASMPIFIGGVIRWLVSLRDKKRDSDVEADSSPGVLYSSGLIAGGAIGGIAIALLSLNEGWVKAIDLSGSFGLSGHQGTALAAFAILLWSLYRAATKKAKRS